MPPQRSHNKMSTKAVSDSDGSELGDMLDEDESWWQVVENSPDIQRQLDSPQKVQVARERMYYDQSPTKSASGFVVGNSSRMQPSLAARSAGRAEAESSIPNPPIASFPLREHRGTVPVTPTKPKVPWQEPPSTGTRMAWGFNQLNMDSPSKPDKGKALRSLPSGSSTKEQPSRTVLVELSSDEEDEVTDMLAEEVSPVSTQPSPLFPTTRLSQESWTSFEDVNLARKRPRSSDSDIEVEVQPARPGLLDHVTPILPKSKARKENREDSPTKLARTISLPDNPLTFPYAYDTPPSVGEFFGGKLETDLSPNIIAHSKQAQELMDKLRLAWGVQYELARGVTLQEWTWENVCSVLREKPADLTGANAEAAYKVRAVMQDRPTTRNANQLLWKELDREQAAILENKGRGLGLMGEWDGQENWYGGRIQQIAKLSKAKDGRGYSIHLEAMEKRRSHRFARFCGSRRILQLRIPEKLIFDECAQLKEFFQRKFILCGRVFVPFYAKDHRLYMVEINEDWERQPQQESGDLYRKSYTDFVNWHNPPAYNFKQALSKYVTRFALGLSTTVPVLEFDERNMFLIDDIYGNEYKGGSPSAEETMTDGCGLINQTALIAINAQLNKQILPVALQGRIAGAKGLWLLHPTDESLEPKIWVRASQNKIKLPHLERSHRIFELVAPSHPSSTVSISQQSIVNLSFNGVPDEVLLSCVEKGLTEEIEPLLKWNHPHASLHLWSAINKSGAVSRSRLSRATAGISRALGLTRRVWKEDDDEEEVVDFDEEKSADTGRNEYSGAPLGLHEAALELVQAGFLPSAFKPLRDKIENIVATAIKSYVENFRIHLPESLEGFVVPDPLGILEEGEIYYRSSQPLIDPRTQRDFHVLTGDVILGRYPIRLASDLQKVTAVDKSDLFPWPDVIIASTKGPRSLASLLSGGDMDGDELFILREVELVRPFENKPFVPPPHGLLEDNFQKHVETVKQFCERVIESVPSQGRHVELQKALLLSLSGDRKGLYSKFHDNAIEKYGYNSPEAIRLAYMFNTLLDASKSGLILAEGIFEQDQKKYGSKFKDKDDEAFVGPTTQKKVAPPTTNLSSNFYILTKLQDRAVKTGEGLKKAIVQEVQNPGKCDPQLAKPYETATNFAHDIYRKTGIKHYEEDMSKIREHVRKAYDEWTKASAASAESRAEKGRKKKGSPKSDDGKFKRVAMIYAEEIEDINVIANVEEIKASFAHAEWPASGFSVNVAFRQLCEIKAKASKGGLVPCIPEIDEMKTIPASCIRAVERSYAD
ncbi:hypothetical protein NP233_g7159 [Leucocoprinus birnbaumii]|uniref:RNA-dependent RNA polymerase n=1 Tax=Leucocoprinus birnbaumii TaxID=56174 RepID=A0AAD5VPS2_9AGAR|nr:hypothetical protein NP233_g7159 [Leucocoprinus birnbaumii]